MRHLDSTTVRSASPHRPRTRRLAGLVCAACACAVHAGDPPVFTAHYLGEASGAAAMNDDGIVVGSTSTPDGMRAWWASIDQALTVLPLPAGAGSSTAAAISSSGVIVGAAGPSSSPEFGGQAVAWTPDGAGGYDVATLGWLPGHVASAATAVNAVGDIVGYSFSGMYRLPALFTPEGVEDLSATGIFDPQAINDRRVLVDRSFTCKRLDLGTMVAEDLGVPAGEPVTYMATSGAAINEHGDVAGVAIIATSTSCDRQAAVYTDEGGWEILSQCGSSNGAHDINDRGDVVMRLNIAPYVRLAGIGTYRIEDLVSEDQGHWYLINTFGLAINDARHMAVGAHNPTTGQAGVVLLVPRAGADLDGDGVVGVTDLLMLLASWGACSGCAADLDGDGLVGVTDLLELLSAWG